MEILVSKNISMEILKILAPYFWGILTIAFLEYLWLMHIMNAYITKSFGDLIVTENGKLTANIVPGFLAWGVIVALWYIFVIRSGYASSYLTALLYGGLIWALSYAMYDLTNLSFIKNYPVAFSYIDIFWWAFLGSAVCLVMYIITIF